MITCAHCGNTVENGSVCKCVKRAELFHPLQAKATERLAKLVSKKDGPTTTELIGNYSIAVANWIAAGRPTRTQEEILQILEVQCQTCEQYNVDKQSCRKCGCKINQSKSALRNKIAMGTEHCPIGRW